MNSPLAETPGAPPANANNLADWNPLPARARPLFTLGTALGLAMPGAVLGFFFAFKVLDAWPLVGAGTGAAIGFLLGTWIGFKQFRYTAWRLDEDGLALRRGRTWQRETRVPITRVQHLDLKRGPWQRKRDLATLVVHTAGTRNSSVTVPHLDAGDAERLRDRLGRQLDHDGD